jgi:hypothetical protein
MRVKYDFACLIVSKNKVVIPIVCICLEYTAKDETRFVGTFDSCGHTTWGSVENVSEITRFAEIASELAMVLSSPCRTADEIFDAAKAYARCDSIEAAENIHEAFGALYKAYEFALRASDNPEGPGWNDEIIKTIRESGSLTESEIFLGKTSFTQAIINRVVTNWVLNGRLGKIAEYCRPGSESNTTGEMFSFDYSGDDFLPPINGGS